MHHLQVCAIVCKLGFPCFFRAHLDAYKTLHRQFSFGKTMKVSTTKATGSEIVLLVVHYEVRMAMAVVVGP